MRRSLVLVVAALILLVASTASAQWYVGMRMAGYYTEVDISGDGYRHDIDLDADGLFDFREAVVGYGMDAFDLELSFGYNTYSEEHTEEESGRQYDYDNSLSMYTFGITGLYHVFPADPVGLDAGLRAQLMAMNYEGITSSGNRFEETYTDDFSGWAFGPVIRARYFFADGALAIGPELYLKYSSMTCEENWDYESRDEPDFTADSTTFGTEFSVRMDWFF
jgi:hypothetical protein